MRYVYGMIGGLRQLMENTHLPSRLCGSSEYRQTEHLTCHHLRAGEREEYATGFDFLKRLCIEFAIADQPIFQSRSVFCKSGWVKYYEIVGILLHLRQIFEGIESMCLVARVAGKIKLDISISKGGCLAEESTESTLRAPPLMAYTENPPV